MVSRVSRHFTLFLGGSLLPLVRWALQSLQATPLLFSPALESKVAESAQQRSPPLGKPDRLTDRRAKKSPLCEGDSLFYGESSWVLRRPPDLMVSEISSDVSQTMGEFDAPYRTSHPRRFNPSDVFGRIWKHAPYHVFRRQIFPLRDFFYYQTWHRVRDFFRRVPWRFGRGLSRPAPWRWRWGRGRGRGRGRGFSRCETWHLVRGPYRHENSHLVRVHAALGRDRGRLPGDHGLASYRRDYEPKVHAMKVDRVPRVHPVVVRPVAHPVGCWLAMNSAHCRGVGLNWIETLVGRASA
jgi:hypothetical protein